jgi:NTP pyrophosphatase (non-canonical NTP hydrolase)
VADELADVLICTDLVTMIAGIDLEAALMMKFNASSEKLGVKTRNVNQSRKNGRAMPPRAP